MRRILAGFCLLGICLFCHCKRPTPPDDARMAQSMPPAQENQSP